MPEADEGPLGPQMESRLREELDAVHPPFSSPRYLSARRRPVAWRLAPAALAAAIFGIIGLTAYAGSPNPVVWTEHVFTVIRPAAASPTPPASPAPASPSAKPSPTPTEHESPEPSGSPEPRESPEPSGSPEPRESPEPSGDAGGGDH